MESAKHYQHVDEAGIEDTTDLPPKLNLRLVGPMAEMRQHSLLTAEEEYVLGTQIQTGFKAKSVLENDNGQISDELREQLENQVEAGQAAKETFASHNTRLVVSIAKGYYRSKLDMEDLIQEGAAGMMHAVEKFDPDKGFRFSTYATWWIRQAIARTIANASYTIRRPVQLVEEAKTITKTISQLEQLRLDISEANIAEFSGLEIARVQEYFANLNLETTSLDLPVGPDGTDTLMDFRTSDESLEDEVLEQIEQDTKFEVLLLGLAELTERERGIILMRYGLVGNGEQQTLSAIRSEFNISRETIRKILAGAEERLRIFVADYEL